MITISYSLFLNTNRKKPSVYSETLKKSSTIYKSIFGNDTNMVVYYDNSVNKDILSYLESNDVILKHKNYNKNWEGTFWRFEELDNIDNDNDIVILQDADTFINVENNLYKKMSDKLSKEKNMNSYLHHGGPTSIRKIKNEKRWVLAGSTMIKGKLPINIKECIGRYNSVYREFGGDEYFLRDYVWEHIKEKCLINIEKRSMNDLSNIINTQHSIVPKWMLEDNYKDRISNWTKK